MMKKENVIFLLVMTAIGTGIAAGVGAVLFPALCDKPDAPADRPPTVEWFGWPMACKPYDGPDPDFYGDNSPRQFYRPTVLLGFRDDGVVVWQKIDPNTKLDWEE